MSALPRRRIGDHLLEQAPPVAHWGTEFVSPRLPDQTVMAEIRRVLVDQPDTRVLIGPSPSYDLTLQPSDIFEFSAEADLVVTSDKPMELVSYTPELPSLLIHAPTSMHGTKLAFGVDAEDTGTAVVIVAPVGAAVQLDGVPVAPGAWTTIAGFPWQRMQQLAAPGYHVITSDVPAGAVVVGASGAATHSYVVPASEAAPPPLACDAGGPYTVGCEGETIPIDGSGSTGELPLAFAWVALSGGVTFADASAAVTDATFTGAGPWSVQLTVSDVSGSQSCVVAVVPGADVTPPDVTCPVSVTVLADSIGQATVPVIASATDGCDPAPVITNDRTTGGASAADAYRCGETLVTFTAVDASGNSADCVTRVVVFDRAIPEELSPAGAAIPLRVVKYPPLPGSLKLTHAMPLGATSAVNIYRGTLPARGAMTYDHVPFACAATPVEGAPGTAEWTLPVMTGGSHYFLVSASNCAGEGSRGRRSDGVERPGLAADCGAVR